jgi:GT2 family glycosyltransferase
MQNKIPVLGTAVVNGVHWLQRLIDSVDYPVEKFVIIDNNGRGQLEELLAALVKRPHDYIEKFYVVTMPGNIGCAGAWNLIIKSTLMAPHWVIVNHDVAFGKGFLEEMDTLVRTSGACMVFGEKGSVSGGFDCFAITDFCVDYCGLFDENFYPAYAEDMDYTIRVKKAGLALEYIEKSKYFHGDKGYAASGSQTWREEPELEQKLLKANWINQHEYIREKWGKDFPIWGEGFNDVEKAYDHPFNKEDDRLYATFSLSFARRKYLGF